MSKYRKRLVSDGDREASGQLGIWCSGAGGPMPQSDERCYADSHDEVEEEVSFDEEIEDGDLDDPDDWDEPPRTYGDLE